MYYDEFFPFYAAYAEPLLYERENIQEKEFALMKSWYPESVRRLQERVEQECQLLDYEGSRIYDEYPDRWSCAGCAGISGKQKKIQWRLRWCLRKSWKN